MEPTNSEHFTLPLYGHLSHLESSLIQKGTVVFMKLLLH